MKTRFDQIEALAQSGKLAELDLDALNLLLAECHRFSKVNIEFVHTDEVKQVMHTIRHQIALKEAEKNYKKLRHHWTLTPSFVVIVLTMFFAAIAAVPVIREWFPIRESEKQVGGYAPTPSIEIPTSILIPKTSPVANVVIQGTNLPAK